MDRRILATGAFFGLTAVVLGALGAHALKKMLDAAQLASFETAVRFQMYHAFLLLFIGSAGRLSVGTKKWAGGFATMGILFFSGSIYLLTTAGLDAPARKIIGPVTPVGGALLMVAWIILFIDFLRKKS